jgi:DNA-binding transcriptional LysR family regulator
MNFLSLEYFLVIAEEGNLSRAAERLFVSQQALSEHVKKLEDETQVALLRRSGGVSLTSEGKLFLDGAKAVLDARDSMLKSLAATTHVGHEKLSISFRHCDPPDELPALLALFESAHPDCDCVVLPPALRARGGADVDLYFSSPPLDDGMENIPLFEEKEYAVVASRALLARIYGERLSELEPKILEQRDLALLKDLPFAATPKRRGRGAEARATVFERAGFTPIVGFQSDSEEMNTSICACGLAAYIGPLGRCRQKFAGHLKSGDDSLALYPIVVPGMTTSIAISYEKGKELQDPEKSFIETAKKYLQEHRN